MASSSDFSTLVASAWGDSIYLSQDKGLTWQQMNSGSARWKAVTASSTGSRLAAAAFNG